MRRAALAVVGLLGLMSRAWAEPWTVTMEGGGEADSNVQRVESSQGAMPRVAAPVGSTGARLDHKDHLLGGTYALGLSGLARMVASSRINDENVMLLAGDGRWLHPIGERPVALGFGLTAADAFPIASETGARTFRNLGGDALIALGTGEDRHLMLAVGGRDFRYKPNHSFDWRGGAASARFDLVLWQPDGKTRSLELAATLGFEARGYRTTALTNTCSPSATPASLCSARTTLIRRDRYQRAGLELGWTGEIVATAGYQLTVINSNSYGQSQVRHRVMASATTELIDQLFGTVTATLQIDQYPDGLLVANDLQHQEFTNLEDENRSSLQVRIARALTSAWSLETRGAIWRDLGNPGAAAFRRELVYAGVIYSH
jgi:hypothetical protein